MTPSKNSQNYSLAGDIKGVMKIQIISIGLKKKENPLLSFLSNTCSRLSILYLKSDI